MELFELKNLKIGQYPFLSEDKIRYADTDRQGHVNNAIFNQFLETARIELLYNPKKPLSTNGCSFVIVSLKMEFLKMIQWPGMVKVGTIVTRIGNSSIQLLQGIYQDNQVVAVAESTIVQVDNLSNLSTPLSASSKEQLQRYFFNHVTINK
jgi:acyl-CoA thioester hydrolase